MYTLQDYSVKYNRKAKNWELHNGQLLSRYPAGKAGKIAAMIDLIYKVDPELAELTANAADRQPHMARTVVNGALLLQFGHVSQATHQFGIAEVLTQKQEADPEEVPSYRVSEYHTALKCTCPAYRGAFAVLEPCRTIVCKHIIAVMMAQKLNRLAVVKWPQKEVARRQHRGREVVIKTTASPATKVFTV